MGQATNSSKAMVIGAFGENRNLDYTRSGAEGIENFHRFQASLGAGHDGKAGFPRVSVQLVEGRWVLSFQKTEESEIVPGEGAVPLLLKSIGAQPVEMSGDVAADVAHVLHGQIRGGKIQGAEYAKLHRVARPPVSEVHAALADRLAQTLAAAPVGAVTEQVASRR